MSADGSPILVHSAIQLLRKAGVRLQPGLTDLEVESCQQGFDFCFPPDLRLLLQTALPVGCAEERPGRGFPNWRELDRTDLREAFAWPMQGIAFDIEHNAFWFNAWGPRPDELEEAIAVARKHVAAAPKLIPVSSHRYIPAVPSSEGNPVFSVYQTDIIYYGMNLWAYLLAEFAYYAGDEFEELGPRREHAEPRYIPFWGDLAG